MLHLKYSARFLLTFSFLAFVAINSAFSQSNSKVDSLKAVLSKYSQEDTVKAKLLVKISEALVAVNANEGIVYSDKALALLANFNMPELKADALKAKAAHLWVNNKFVNNKFNEALDLVNKALEIYEQLNLTQKIALAHNTLGAAYIRKLDYNIAIKYYERALVLCEQIKDEKTKLQSLNGLGAVYQKLSKYEKAIEYSEQMLALAQKLNLQETVANALGRISIAYISLHNYTKSLEYVKKAVVINESIGSKDNLCYNYRDLGTIYEKLSDIPKALDYYNKALKFAEETGNKREEATLIRNIAVISKNPEMAIGYLEKAASEYEKTGNLGAALATYANLSYLTSNANNYLKSLDYNNKALAIAIKSGNKQEQCMRYSSIGINHKFLGNYAQSIEYLQKALVLSENINYTYAMPNIYLSFINIYLSLSDTDKALDYCNKGLIIAKKIGNVAFEAAIYKFTGECYRRQERYEEAIENIEKSRDRYKAIGDIVEFNNSIMNLGQVFYYMGRKLDAHRCFQEALDNNRKTENKHKLAGSLIDIASLYVEESDSLVLKMGVNPNERYAKATVLLTEASDLGTKLGALDIRLYALLTLSRLQEKNKDYVNAYNTYQQYIVLKDSTRGDEVKKQITRKEIQYEFDKKETALKYEQQLTADQLEKQKLLTVQQEQALTLNQQNLTLKEQALALSNKEKDLAHLAFLKEQAEKQEKTQQLSLSQEREKGKERDLNIKNLALSAQQKQNLYLGLLAAVLLGGLGTLGYFYTTLQKKNRIIAQQNELNEQTIAILSHDIKEPLLGVKLMLKKLNKDDPFVAQASKSLEGQINAVNGILTNLLKMKKLSLLKKDKNVKANAQSVVQNVVTELSVAIQSKSLTIQNDLTEDVLLPIAPEKLQIIVHNLLSNAVKYSFPNQTIRIYKEGKGICIQDFGVGLSPEQRTKLMREVTASQRGTNQERGNGMGLFLIGAMLQGEQIKVVFDSPEVGGTIAKVLG